MTRTLLLLSIILSLPLSGFAQSTIYKTWIGPAAEYLEISKAGSKFDGVSVNVGLHNDTLHITDNVYDPDVKKSIPRTMRFKTIRLTKDTLILSALDDVSRDIVCNGEQCVYINRDIIVDDNLSFQSLQFSAPGYYKKESPSIALSIDATGKIYILKRYYANKDTKELLTGQLSKKQLIELTRLLKISGLDMFDSLRQKMHSSAYFFVIYYNNKKMQIFGSFPMMAGALEEYLLSIYKKVHLNKAKTPYVFEDLPDY